MSGYYNPLHTKHYNPRSLTAKIAVIIVFWPLWLLIGISLMGNMVR